MFGGVNNVLFTVCFVGKSMAAIQVQSYILLKFPLNSHNLDVRNNIFVVFPFDLLVYLLANALTEFTLSIAPF